MASLYATTVCLLRLHGKVQMTVSKTRWSQRKLRPVIICQHLSTCYLAPTNSSQGGSLLQRWTVSNGPKLSVRYSTLSEQLWSKSTLGATLVDLQDIVAYSSGLITPQGHPSTGTSTVEAIVSAGFFGLWIHVYDTAFTCARNRCGDRCGVSEEQLDSCNAKKLAATRTRNG